jgi:hypothetical protein
MIVPIGLQQRAAGTGFSSKPEIPGMKEKIYNPASTNEQAPAEGMAAVNTFNSEELDDQINPGEPVPKNFEREQDRRQHDDQDEKNR